MRIHQHGCGPRSLHHRCVRCPIPQVLPPPVAAKKPHSVTHHGITVTDDYAWLRDPGYPEVTDKDVLAYLEAENAWFEARMAPHKAADRALFKEMRGRIKEADKSVPQKDGDWLYWIEFEEGAEYKKWWRRPVGARDDGSADELILDEVGAGRGQGLFPPRRDVGQPGRQAAGLCGRRQRLGTLHRADQGPGDRRTAADEIPGTLSALVWVAGDTGSSIRSPTSNGAPTMRGCTGWASRLDEDVELYHEDDEGFRVGSSLSANEKWLIIVTGDHETSEVRLVPADDPLAAADPGRAARRRASNMMSTSATARSSSTPTTRTRISAWPPRR